MHSAHSKANAIVPLPSSSASTASSGPRRGPSVSKIAAPHVTFLQTFGWLGVPMVAVSIVASLWTSWLIMLTIEPNATANLLMDTGEFDNGSFWLIIDPEPVLMAFSVSGLCLVVFGYLLVLGRMTLFRSHHANRFYSRVKARIPRIRAGKVSRRHPALVLWTDVTGFHGRYRKYWVRELKI